MKINNNTKRFNKEKKKVEKKLKTPFHTLSSNNETANQSKQGIVTVQSILNNVNRAATGVVSFALSKGYAARAEDPSYPFFAMVYLSDIVVSAMQSSGYSVQAVPKWLHYLIHLLNPKRHDFNTGSLTFTWNIDFNPNSSQWTVDLGPLGSGRHVNFGVVDTSSYLNTLFPSITVPPTPYTLELGAAAWTSVLNFLKDYDKALTDMIGVAEPSSADYDPSAFCACIKYVGGAGDGTGGFMMLQELEVFIKTPMSGVFTKLSSTPVDGTRAPNYSAAASGDACFLTGVLCSELPSKLVKGRLPPVFSPIDFNEFVDVTAKWCSRVATEASSDYQSRDKVVEDVSTFKVPLTLQEVTLLLRNTMLQAFNHTQFAVQGIYPAENTSTNPFVPFVIGVGTHPVASTPMLLPQFLVENIRNLTYKYISGKTSEAYLPVLGIYEDDELNWKDYIYHVTDYGDFQTFIDPSAAYAGPASADKDSKEKDPKGKSRPSSIIVGAESPVNIVTGVSAGQYYTINDLNALSVLADRWNEWVASIKPYSMTLTSVAADGGIAVANVVSTCDIITFDDVDLKGKDITKRTKHTMCARLAKSKSSSPTLYANRKYYATCSRDPFYEHVWGVLQQYYIRPRLRLLTGATPPVIMTLDKMVNYRRNPYTLVPFSGDPDDLDEIHGIYASLMVKPRNGGKLAIEETIQTLESQYGRAGILSSLFGPVVKAMIPGSGSIVDTIGSFLP